MVGLFSFAFLQEDCLTVLQQIEASWHVPADTVYEAIARQGWILLRGPLSPGTTCSSDFWRCTLTISDRLHEELDCPDLYEEVLHWILAAELGRIRLYSQQILQGKRLAAFDECAHFYAMAFLLPEDSLRAHPELPTILLQQPNGNECWRSMSRIAETFRVPTSTVQAALERYGILTQPLQFLARAA